MSLLSRFSWKRLGLPSLPLGTIGPSPSISWSMPSARSYPPHWYMKHVSGQNALMMTVLPELRQLEFIPPVLAETQLGDGWGLLPTIPALGRVLGISRPYNNYHLLVQRLLETLDRHCQFESPFLSPGKALTTQDLWLESQTRYAYERQDELAGDASCFIWPVSLGNEFRHQLPEEARPRIFASGGIPLCSVHVALLLIGNPGRLDTPEALWIDNAGDEGVGDGPGYSSSFFRCSPSTYLGGGLRFNIDGSVPKCSGIAVGFPPQW